MPSFEQDINEFRQFIIAVKVFPPTKDASAYEEGTRESVQFFTGARVIGYSPQDRILT